MPRIAFVVARIGVLVLIVLWSVSQFGFFEATQACAAQDRQATIAVPRNICRDSATSDSQQQSEIEGVALLSDEPGEAVREVGGIVCDNLKGMPEGMKNHLILRLPPTLRGATITGYSVACANAVPVKRSGTKIDEPLRELDNTGKVVLRGGRLIYFPPDEFNRVQEPVRYAQVTKEQDRSVRVTVSVALPDSHQRVSLTKDILLRRPPVILVHGVAASAGMWQGRSERGFPLASSLYGFGFDLSFLDHGRSSNNSKNKSSHKSNSSATDRRGKVGNREDLLFFGNGSVEYAAELLDKQIRAKLQAVRHGSPSFAIRRIDLVGHSYGGLIARWYLRLANRKFPETDSRRWYAYAANNAAKPGLYRLPDTFFNAPPYRSVLPELAVRKLITLATPWRGTPIANYINQAHAPADPLGLHSAPILFIPFFKLDGVLGLLARLPSPLTLPTRVPAVEVNAVESRWLQFLNGYVEEGKVKPFLDHVAYASLAGDNTALLSESFFAPRGSHGGGDLGFDIYSLIDLAQVPSRFPYLVLERHAGTSSNYSDGLIPLWSALIPYGEIVPANHNTILYNDRAMEDVVCWLSSAALPDGETLNDKWGQPIETNVIDETDGSKKRWEFVSGSMAPWPESEIYGLVGDTARIKPGIAADIKGVKAVRIPGGVTLIWNTPFEMDGSATVYEFRLIDFSRWELIPIQTVDCSGLGKTHQATITGLNRNATYYYRVVSDYSDPLNGVLELQSDLYCLGL